MATVFNSQMEMDHGGYRCLDWKGKSRPFSILLIAFIVRFSWKKKKSSFGDFDLSNPLSLKQDQEGQVKSFQAFLSWQTYIYGMGPLIVAKMYR
jgi:hypothetical protein